MDQIKIGKLIAKQRKEKGLTQQDLGDKVGVGYRAVSKWETGQTMPDISIINELSQILGITADELLKGELNKQNKAPKSKKKYLLLLIPLVILIISIIYIIKQDNKVYEYDLKSASETDYQVNGKLTLKANTIIINIDKIGFNNYDLYSTIIKNYEYRMSTNNKSLVGVGYNDASNTLVNELPISEFQKKFKIYYHDKLLYPKDEVVNNVLELEFNFIDINDNIINKKLEIMVVPIEKNKSTN